MRIALVVLLLGVSAVPARAQLPVDDVVRRLVSMDTFTVAAAFLERDHDRLVRELVTLTEIPAPPFKEHARAEAFLSMLREHGLSDVERDAEGNVMGVRRGAGAGPMLVV